MVTRRRTLYRLVIAATCCSLLYGCTVVGPGSIRSGRMAYNEAIRETNNQQMLMVPVHNRYEESNHMLGVASVTANVSVSSKAAVEAGFGSSDSYSGNLVPFSGGFVYEENPTISYLPVTGEAYLRQLMSPLPLSVFAQASHFLPEPGFAYEMLVSSINGIHNPAFLYHQQSEDPRFGELVDILTSLRQHNRLHWASGNIHEEQLSLVINAPAGDTQVSRLLQLLGLASLATDKTSLAIPVSLSLNNADEGHIGMTTRSLWELVEILSSAVEVPASDEAEGIASPFPRSGPIGSKLSILHAQERPEDSYVAVEFRDGWFYIDNRDLTTKRYFKLLGNLWSAAISESLSDGAASPVLTVPVSR